MENLGSISFTGKDVKAPICKHLHPCLFLDLCSTSHLEVNGDICVQKVLHIFQSSFAWGHRKQRGQHRSEEAKEMSSFQCQNLLQQLMKATVGHSENWPRNILKATRLLEMIENLERHHLAQIWDYTLRQETLGIITKYIQGYTFSKNGQILRKKDNRKDKAQLNWGHLWSNILKDNILINLPIQSV